MVVDEPLLDVEAIQGNILRGFNAPFMALLGLQLPDSAPAAKAYLRELLPDITPLKSVHALRLMRSAGLAEAVSGTVYLNVALSRPGLERIGVDTSAVQEPFFMKPMGDYAGALNDPLDAQGTALNYELGLTWTSTPEVLLIIGADALETLQGAVARHQALAQATGCIQIYSQPGASLPGLIEHFGFRDGISQVGVRGRLSKGLTDFLTPRFLLAGDPLARTHAKPGQPLVWPGQFVFGYPVTQDDDLAAPGPVITGLPWMRNGSFLVFRRLAQHVDKFRNFAAQAAQRFSEGLGREVSAQEAQALFVGRWPNGTPLLADATGDDASVTGDDMQINNYDFANATPALEVIDGAKPRTVPAVIDDRRAQVCPRFAHVRKVNPRGLSTDQNVLTAKLQMLRRGIPFGPLFEQDPGAERGLLFMAYMTSVERQFRLLTAQWMNNTQAPETNEPGHDMLVGQATPGEARRCAVKDTLGNTKVEVSTLEQFVTSTGGGVFFSPGLDVLAELTAH